MMLTQEVVVTECSDLFIFFREGGVEAEGEGKREHLKRAPWCSISQP